MDNKNNTAANVQTSMRSIYSELLNKRQAQREEKEARKLQEKEERQAAKAAAEAEQPEKKLTKKEKRQVEINNWQEIVIGLTGDDLDYTDEKKSRKKKYSKWIGDNDENKVEVKKPKKVKKKNYNKEFENELNMLKTLVNDANKFTNDLQKRFQNAAGPASKDAMPLSKTLVELASAINASRTNSLGVLREIGSIKKTVADLYMKQKKLDSELNATGKQLDTQDTMLMGSDVAASLFGSAANNIGMALNGPSQDNYTPTESSSIPVVSGTVLSSSNSSTQYPSTNTSAPIENFDPSTWGGVPLSEGNSVAYENTPKEFVVEWYKDEGKARVKAINTETGEEIVGCPVPSINPKDLTFNEKDGVAKSRLDEIYKLEVKTNGGGET